MITRQNENKPKLVEDTDISNIPCIELAVDMVKTILKMDLNIMITPLTQNTNMNSFDISNTIVNDLSIDKYVSCIIKEKNRAEFIKPISKILFGELYRLTLEATKLYPNNDTIYTTHLNSCEDKIFNSVKKALAIL